MNSEWGYVLLHISMELGNKDRHRGSTGHNNYRCMNLRQSVEIVCIFFFMGVGWQLDKQHISPPLRIFILCLPPFASLKSIIAGHEATSQFYLTANTPLNRFTLSIKEGMEGFIFIVIEKGRYGTCAHRPTAEGVSAFQPWRFWLTRYLSRLQTVMHQGMIKHIQMLAFAGASPVSH